MERVDRVKETPEEKECNRITKILKSSDDEDKHLYVYNGTLSIIKKPDEDTLALLANRLVLANPDTAFIITDFIDTEPEVTKIDRATEVETVVKPGKDGFYQFILVIPIKHKTMSKNAFAIIRELKELIHASKVINSNDNLQQTDRFSDIALMVYFGKVLKSTDFTGKISDNVCEIVFNYMKKNKYIPEEESDEEDKYANFDDIDHYE